jgi:DNA-binding NarL/FixJ family response regulator
LKSYPRVKRSKQVIVIEDSVADYELITHALTLGEERFNARRIDAPDELTRELERLAPDVVLCDHGHAKWDSFAALSQVREFYPGLPFVVISGFLDDATRQKLLQGGVDECVAKDRMNELSSAVRFALRLGEERRLRRAAEIERDVLRRELAGLQARGEARGVVPICAECKQIRDVSQNWRPLEEYFREEFSVRFSHGLCPCCVDRFYEDARTPQGRALGA